APGDVTELEDELTGRFPWLLRLSNGEHVVSIFAQRVAWMREARAAARERDALPDPAGTIVSVERAARSAAREVWERRRLRAARMLATLPNSAPVDLRELVAADFLAGDTPMERAGRAAALAELGRHRGSIGLDVRGAAAEVRVYIDGAWLPMDGGG